VNVAGPSNEGASFAAVAAGAGKNQGGKIGAVDDKGKNHILGKSTDTIEWLPNVLHPLTLNWENLNRVIL
jgi:hypothetical protein